jgi:hypothetical protein
LNEATAALLGALIGAAAGIAGGAFAAIASLRASQIAARAPLGPILHQISNALTRLRVTRSTSEYADAQMEFQRRWNEFSIQQRILCPSKRIGNLMDLIRATAADNRSEDRDALLLLAGQTMERVTRMVAAHSNHLFRCCARREEAKIVQDWLASPEGRNLGDAVRANLQSA